MPEFGVIFKFNADYDHVSWYGLGEAETYGLHTCWQASTVHIALPSDFHSHCLFVLARN